jgi:hypothetical protein
MSIGAADVRPKLKWPIHEASEEERVEQNPGGEDCKGDGHASLAWGRAPDEPCDSPGALPSLEVPAKPTETEMTDLKIFPIVSWKTEATPAGYGVLTITTLPFDLGAMQPAETGKTAQAHHFGIAAEQLELIVKDLSEMAAALREKRKTSN